MVPLTLYGTGIVWSLTCIYGAPHVKCLHVLYDSYGPPYLIWNWYHMVPHMYDMIFSGQHVLNMTLMVPIPYMELVFYGPPHVKCLHVLYDSYGPPFLIWNRYHMVPTCTI